MRERLADRSAEAAMDNIAAVTRATSAGTIPTEPSFAISAMRGRAASARDAPMKPIARRLPGSRNRNGMESEERKRGSSEIGRASCGERVWKNVKSSGVAETVKKKK